MTFAQRAAALVIPTFFTAASACTGETNVPPPNAPSSPTAAQPSAKSPLGEALPAKPTVADAQAFVADVNEELKKIAKDSDRASWVKSTYITPDTE